MAKSADETKNLAGSSLWMLKSMDFGALPVLVGLALIAVAFQLANPNFLTPLNLTNLMAQISGTGIISVGVILVLLIGEIDLSVGSVSGMTAAIMAVLATVYHLPTVLAIFIAIFAGILVGTIQGFFVAKVHVPAFVVTLAGLLVWQGAQLLVLGDAGTINLRDPMIKAIANALLPPWLGWGMGVVAAAVVVISSLRGRRKRARAGLVVQSISLEIARLVFITFGILFAIWIMNNDRNQLATGQPIRGVPACVLIFIGFVILFYLITHYSVFGRHIFTVGGNAEASRRASIDVDAVRMIVFALCSGISACGGIVFASRLNAVNYGSGGGSVMMNAIAAAVIGGTSLFGGRGSTWAALLGALVIGSINNGMDLLSFPSSIKYIVTGVVLLLAVILDAVSRERRRRAGKG
jgi:D-xylose transport system permease protein